MRNGGHVSTFEAGRAIIQDQMRIGGTALPWADRTLYAQLMLSWEMRSFAETQSAAGPVLFDRGAPDVVGYLRLCGLEVPPPIGAAAGLLRYDPVVFIAPPWREIFTGDAERKQDFAEAVRTHDALAAVYGELGYRLVELPRADIEQRADFMLERLAATA